MTDQDKLRERLAIHQPLVCYMKASNGEHRWVACSCGANTEVVAAGENWWFHHHFLPILQAELETHIQDALADSISELAKVRARLTDEITAYLTNGGLWNPEMAIHDGVRDLLMRCRDQLAPGPCGKHRMCDWAYGSPLPDRTWNWEHPTASTTTGHCLSCERESDERRARESFEQDLRHYHAIETKAAVQAFAEKAATLDFSVEWNDVICAHEEGWKRAIETYRTRIRALAAEGGGK